MVFSQRRFHQYGTVLVARWFRWWADGLLLLQQQEIRWLGMQLGHQQSGDLREALGAGPTSCL